jgi:hypothetical protein
MFGMASYVTASPKVPDGVVTTIERVWGPTPNCAAPNPILGQSIEREPGGPSEPHDKASTPLLPWLVPAVNRKCR